MGDEDRSHQLPQRVRGEARAGPDRPAQSAPLTGRALSDDLRKKIQAAVAAERANAAQGTGHAAESSAPGNPAGTGNGHKRHSTLNGINGKKRNGIVIGPGPIEGRVMAGPSPAPAPAATVTAHPDPDPDPVPVRPGPGLLPGPQPAAQRKSTRRRRVRLMGVAAVAAAAVVASVVVLALRPARSEGGSGAVSPALLRQEAAIRDQAAAWVAQQVSPGVTVSCDPVMCAALTDHSFPARSLLVLRPTSSEPLTSAVIVATSAVRDMFGTSLSTALAPGVLASFGSGPAGITVRVIAPDGAAAYQAALRADQAARKTNGSALLNDPRIAVSAIAHRQLAAGLVDSRLLLAVASLAADEPIDIVQFGNLGSGVSPEIPLRFADLAGNDLAAHLTNAAYLRSLRASLNKLNAQFRPARTVRVVLPGNRAVLRVEFTAPSVLGLFGARVSP